MGRFARRSVLDVVEGFHLTQAIAVLHEAGVLDPLERPCGVHEMAAKHGWDPGMLRTVLEYVACRTGLLVREGTRYRTTGRYDADARFLLDQYVGAYGPCVLRIASVLCDPGAGAAAVDRERHARAFAQLDRTGFEALPDVILQLELNHLLDLGCGSGSLLLALAERNPEFTGWGVDANPAMCSNARRRIRAADAQGRIRILKGDCRNPGDAIPAKLRTKIHTVSAVSLLNEFFGSGDAGAVEWLRRLRNLLPGRACLVSDYYGRLGQTNRRSPPLTLLHDFVQALSGQGIPPANLAAWKRIYSAAGCTFVHAIEDHGGTCFVHIVRL
jgi:SAM-dependent methyltransferase